MALVFEGTSCSICSGPIDIDRPFFATSGVWLPSDDRLADYCDSAMHWDCYATWEYRPRFAKSYFEFWIQAEKENPYWWAAYEDAEVFVEVSPEGVQGVWVHLADTGSRRDVALSDWESWLATEGDGEHAVEEQALHAARAVLRKARPTAASLLEHIQRDSKTELFRKLDDDERRRHGEKEHGKREREAHNALCERVMPAILSSGFSCPACGQKESQFRLAAAAGTRSLIICRKCGEVIDPQRFLSSLGRKSAE